MNTKFPRISDEEETIYAVQRKAYLVDRKIELTLGGTASFADRFVQACEGVVVEVVALAEGRQPRRPQDLVDPGPADARDRPLVAQQRVQVARVADPLGELLERRHRICLWAERGHGVVGVDLVDRQQLGPRALLGAELAQA